MRMHDWIYAAVSLFFLAFAAIKIASQSKRQMLGPDAILESFDRKARAIDFATVGDLTGPTAIIWGAADDKMFWSSLGGFKGLLEVRECAILLRSLCMSFNLTQDDLFDVRIISQQCTYIAVLALLQMIVEPFRPTHVLARFAVQLYAEIKQRAEVLCQVHRPDLLVALERVM